MAARTVADNVSQQDLDSGSLYPPLGSIKECSIQIAMRIIEYAYKNGK